MDLQLSGHRALVTGGSRGLGRALCRSLAAEGADVVINYRQQKARAESLAAELRDQYAVQADAIPADVSKEAEVVRLFSIASQSSPIDLLVNNAAVCPTGHMRDMTVEVWRETLATNLDGAFWCCRELARHLHAAGRPGRIVNISSQAAFRGSTTGHAPYDASKGALVTMTVSLARELAPDHIAVNGVAVGMMRTDMTAATLDNNTEKYLDRIPLRRIGDPVDVANMAVFLCSSRAAYMTGATVDVSGGMLMR